MSNMAASQLGLWLLFALICISEGRYYSQGKIQGKLSSVCNKTYFIETYVNPKKHLERNVIEEQYDCQITNCKGTNALSVTYAVNNSSGKYSYLLHTDSDINNVENAGCWGFAVEVITNETAYTLYSDFKTKKEPSLFWIVNNILPGHKYSFTLNSIPAGKVYESVLMVTPSVCGNEILPWLHPHMDKTNCSQPDFNIKRELAEEICQLVPGSLQERIDFMTKNLVETNCSFSLAKKKELKHSTSAARRNTNQYFIYLFIFIAFLTQM
ncbi:uncharacterized protein LOC130654101 [Hydractinia symbiolongicarpus]|uniref:uncharacterized protein LOC130654101 n=1 Tax=Hydractinia symbiolongicarpus TaxID=13093 RepID=UPI00254C02D3|nr:uncharacterized protein LOC130654101 [Hydractinia symbiolongicarpus]